MNRAPVLGGGLLVIASLLVACGGEPSTPPSASSASLAPPASSVPSETATVPTAAIQVDDALIGHLPVEVAGIALTSDPDTARSIASDQDLAATASSIAVAFAIAPGASVGDDVAVVSVVQLKPGVFDPAFFRSWRDSYDTAACEAAGGTAGNAQAVIGGRETDIGTCAAGAHTYHVYLEASNVIVSVTSVGELGLGQQIVAGLRE